MQNLIYDAKFPSDKIRLEVERLGAKLVAAIARKDEFSVQILVARLKRLGYTLEELTKH